jgi:hypothetical protein
MNWLLDPQIFLKVTTALFIFGAVAHLFKMNWPEFTYHAAAAVLQISVLYMGK